MDTEAEAASLLNKGKDETKERYHTSDNIDHDVYARNHFFIIVTLTEAFAVACLVLVILWVTEYMGGFGWTPATVFNYHPLFMVFGFVVCYGNSAIVYRVLREQEKFTVKLIHTGLHFCTFLFVLFALVAVFKYNNDYGNKNMFSLHSWVGMTTVILFCLQFLFGFLAFLFPKFGANDRARYLQYHTYFGAAILGLAMVAVISGITEQMFYVFLATYPDLPPAVVVANLLGLCVVVFILLVGYILHNPTYKRVGP